MTPLLAWLHRTVHLRTNPRPLAVARILDGIAAGFASLEAWRMLTRVLNPAIVKLPFFRAIPLLPAGALHIFIAVWLIAAGLFVFGWKTRQTGAVLTLITGYTLFLDQQTYSNHLYLLVLVTLLLTISDSGAVWSLDARRRPTKGDVPAWPVLLLKAQLTIVYVFSAAAKITTPYLSGEILSQTMKRGGWLTATGSWGTPAITSFLATGSVVVELFIAFGLWSRRLRPFAMLAGAGLHLLFIVTLDSSRLSLAIFALAMFAMYPLFAYEESQPQRMEESTAERSKGTI